MALHKVISGGQSGADIAGLRAAKDYGIDTGGWIPSGYLTEDGPKREYFFLYNLQPTKSKGYTSRTIRNVLESDATIIFGDIKTPGSRLTKNKCNEFGHEWYWVSGDIYDKFRVAEWVDRVGCKTLMVAGNRESKSPGIEQWVYRYLCEVFQALGHRRTECQP